MENGRAVICTAIGLVKARIADENGMPRRHPGFVPTGPVLHRHRNA